jgi:hypothetical protein
MKGVPAMDIYSILSSKPHNPHYINRYITFIEQCQQKNVGYEGYVERHHICPRAKDMFPEYEDFRLHPWNCAILTPRQHDIAHTFLWKIYRNRSMTWARNIMMRNGGSRSKVFDADHRKYLSEIGKENYDGKIPAVDKEGKYIRVSKEELEANDNLSGSCKGKVVVKDDSGRIMQVSIDDPRYISGELSFIATGKVSVRNEEGVTFQVSIDDPRYISGELVSVQKGKVTVKDCNGNTLSVDVNDPRYISGELVPFTKGKMFVKYNGESIMIDTKDYDPNIHTSHKKGTVTVKDKQGNILVVSKDDPRYKSKELVSIHQDIAYGRDKNGNMVKTTTGDERFKTGELMGNNRGKVWTTNGTDNMMIRKDEVIPDGFFIGKTQRKDISSIKDTIYINDGSVNRRISKTDTIPEGWVKGMVKGKIKPYKFITDGKINKKISPDEDLPDGFRYGMAPKKRKKAVK